jgi:hypothetical protein
MQGTQMERKMQSYTHTPTNINCINTRQGKPPMKLTSGREATKNTVNSV